MRLLLVLLALPMLSFAEETADCNCTLLSFSESATVDVAQDRLQATLQIQHEAKDAATVQKYINEKMQAAMVVVRKQKDLKLSTLGYNVYQHERYMGEGKEPIKEWRGNQSLQLDGADSELLLRVAGELQQLGFNIQGLNYYLSREAAASQRDTLIEEAMGMLKKRAQTVAKSLGKTQVEFADIQVDGAQPPRPPVVYAKAVRMEMATMDAAMPSPVADAGETSVSVSIQATVELR